MKSSQLARFAAPGEPSAAVPAQQRANRPNVSHFDALPNAALVSIQALSAINGQGVSTLWRHCKQDPDFPKPIRLSPGCTRFNVGEIRAYLAKKAEASARPARKQRSKGQSAA
jgi:predicted DNA-binding transcriptional regulator AlpA